MRRRVFLSVLTTTILAGCSGDRVPNGETTTGKTDVSSTTRVGSTTSQSDKTETRASLSPVEIRRQHAEVIDQEVTDRTLALTPHSGGTPGGLVVSAEFVSSATTAHPTILKATVHNPLEWTETASTSEVPFFDPEPRGELLDHRGEQSSVWFVPTDNHPLAKIVPEWTRNSQGYWQLSSNESEFLPKKIELDPKESLTAEYAFLVDSDSDLKPGEYSIPGDSGREMQLSVWATSRPGPTQTSRFSIADSVPPLRGDSAPATIWYNQANDSTPIFLLPSSQTVRPPGEIEFTFVNNSHQNVGGTVNEWQMYKRHNGEWHPLTWKRRQAVGPNLLPGQTETWALRAYHGGAVHEEKETEINMGYLGGGTYAFAVHWTASDAEGDQAYATAFSVEAPSISIQTQESVSVHREDRTIVVEASQTDSSETREFELRNATSSTNLLLPEQVMQLEILRNTLSFFDEETDRVLLKTESTWPFPESTFKFEFQGRSFELLRSGTP